MVGFSVFKPWNKANVTNKDRSMTCIPLPGQASILLVTEARDIPGLASDDHKRALPLSCVRGVGASSRAIVLSYYPNTARLWTYSSNSTTSPLMSSTTSNRFSAPASACRWLPPLSPSMPSRHCEKSWSKSRSSASSSPPYQTSITLETETSR